MLNCSMRTIKIFGNSVIKTMKLARNRKTSANDEMSIAVRRTNQKKRFKWICANSAIGGESDLAFFLFIIFTYFSVANNSRCLCFVSIHWWIIGFTSVQEFTWCAQSRTRRFLHFRFDNIIVIAWSASDIGIRLSSRIIFAISLEMNSSIDYCTLIKDLIRKWT